MAQEVPEGDHAAEPKKQAIRAATPKLKIQRWVFFCPFLSICPLSSRFNCIKLHHASLHRIFLKRLANKNRALDLIACSEKVLDIFCKMTSSTKARASQRLCSPRPRISCPKEKAQSPGQSALLPGDRNPKNLWFKEATSSLRNSFLIPIPGESSLPLRRESKKFQENIHYV